MANQSRFFAAALGLSILLGPGVITPGAAEPLSPASPDLAEPDAFAPDGAVPAPSAIPPRGALWVPLGEPDVTGTGSGARDEDFVAATSTDDGWAEAYGDGSRVSYAAIMAPAYPVTLNAQVQYNTATVTAMRAYLDNTVVARSSGPSIYANISASRGTHLLTIQAWDTTGALYKIQQTVNVQ